MFMSEWNISVATDNLIKLKSNIIISGILGILTFLFPVLLLKH